MKIADYVFLLRPQLIIAGLTFVFLGWFSASGIRTFLDLEEGILLLSFIMIMGSMNIVNELFDLKTDRLNKSKNFLIKAGMVTKREAIILSVALLGLGLFLSFALSMPIFLLCLLSIVMTFLYTNPVLSLKSVPPFDLLLNSIGNGFVCFSVGWILSGTAYSRTFYSSIPYMLLMAGVYLATTIPDIACDSQAHITTTGVLLGKRKTLASSAAFILAAAVVFIYQKDYLGSVLGTISIVFFLIANLRTDYKSVRRTFIWTAGLFTIAMFVFWFYALFVLASMWFLRVYYRQNFQKSYP